MTLEEYFQQCDDSYNYFKDVYERMTPEQRRVQDAKDRQESKDRSFRKYITYLQERGYGSEPMPEPVTPKELIRYGDAQKLEAVINHLENRVNELDGFKKMAHSHSKGVKEQESYF